LCDGHDELLLAVVETASVVVFGAENLRLNIKKTQLNCICLLGAIVVVVVVVVDVVVGLMTYQLA